METMETALRNAGWSDDLIKTFMNTDNEVVNPVSMSDFFFNSYNYNQESVFDQPQKTDSSTFVMSVE